MDTANSFLPPGTDTKEAAQRIVGRAQSLYSLPAVAAEVLRLTNNPEVDVRALKECIENDPALTTKLLRVVNSSLFGLSREVSDLNQAIALLGIKPLKLLVLGFSLPEGLFHEVESEQLTWYWKSTLVRAVAGRELCEQLWQKPGDDVFLAGLLQDIGLLVLLGEFREPYAEFLQRAIDQQLDLRQMEIDVLGFDHTTLTATLLDHWKMPEMLVRSIAEPRDVKRLRWLKKPYAPTARVLHLAELLAQLVGQNRLNVFPDLIEAGEAYCGLERLQLKEIVAQLQTKVDQLANVLSLELPDGMDYEQVLAEAHRQTAEISESVAFSLSQNDLTDEQFDTELLRSATQLQAAVGRFLESPPSSTGGSAPGTAATESRAVRGDGPRGRSAGPHLAGGFGSSPDEMSSETHPCRGPNAAGLFGGKPAAGGQL